MTLCLKYNNYTNCSILTINNILLMAEKRNDIKEPIWYRHVMRRDDSRVTRRTLVMSGGTPVEVGRERYGCLRER